MQTIQSFYFSWKKNFNWINFAIIVIRNGKTVWKHGPYCWYFNLNLDIWGGRTEHKSKQQKMVTSVKNCSVKITWGCFSHFLLLWPWYQGFRGSSEDCYRSKSVSQMLLVCYNLLNSQNIPITQSVKNGWLQRYLR